MSVPIRVVIFERSLMAAVDMPGTVWATQQMGLKTCVAAGKQSSRLLSHIAAEMGVKASQCVTVCSGAAGVAAGRRAGMHVVVYSGDDQRAEYLRGASTSVIRDLHDLPELLRVANRTLVQAQARGARADAASAPAHVS